MSESEGRVEAAGSGAWNEVTTPHRRKLRVRFVIPGELVRIARRDEDPGHADLLEVLEASPHRCEPACSLFGRCGGCQLQHVSASQQLEQRAERARETLRRCGQGSAAESLRLVEAPTPLGYRSRARFQVAGGAGEAWRLGFHEAGGSRTLDAPDCPLLSAELRAAWQALRPILTAANPRGLTGLELTALPDSPATLLFLNPRDRPPEPWPALGEELLASGVVSGVAVRPSRDDERPALLGDEAALGRTPAGRPVAVALGGFLQANLGGADRLCDELIRLAEPAGRRLLELHAGAGLLSHALASAGAELRAFEIDARSVAASHLLPAPPRGSLDLREADAGRAFEAHADDAEVLVTDPSRSGLGELAPAIAERGPARLVGVWCSLEGFERDLQRLGKAYRLSSASLVDLFPQTRHCELVARLDR